MPGQTSAAINAAVQVLLADDQDRLDTPLDSRDRWGDLARRVVAATYDCLSYREKTVLRLLFGERRSYDDVAAHFHISVERVKVMEAQALRKVASQVLR